MFAIMPPEEVAVIIHNERLIFAERYNCVKALKPPIHITIYPPFEEKETIEKEMMSLDAWAAMQSPFSVALKDYSFFKTRFSPVIYIDVEQNPVLQKLRSEFVSRLRKYITVSTDFGPYQPHFTIGYRDVPAAKLPQIKEEYSVRKFNAAFEVKSIFFWKYVNNHWQTIHEFRFSGADKVPSSPST